MNSQPLELYPDTLPGLSQRVADFHARRRHLELEALIRQRVVRPAYAADAVGDPMMLRYLESCYNLVVAELTSDARQLSSAQWLYFLRRWPDWFWTYEDSRGFRAFRRNLAEVISACGPPSHTALQVPGYEPTRRTISIVHQFVAGASYLGYLDWLIRENSRQAQFQFSVHSELPSPVHNAEQVEARELYYERLSKTGGRFMTRSGIDFAEPTNRKPDDIGLFAIAPAARAWSQDTWVQDGGASFTVRTLSGYRRSTLTLTKLGSFLGQYPGIAQRWPPDEFVLAASVLALSSLLVRRPPLWQSMLLYGYISIDYDYLQELTSEWISEVVSRLPITLQSRAPSSGEALLSAAQNQRASTRPLRCGPFLRVDHNLALIDVCAASQVLDASLDFLPDDGDIANVRAAAFESDVQAVIDASHWAPSPSLRALRGNSLRRSGLAVTDVDAIGVNGTTLLLVSAKSRIFTEAFDRGDYAAVRNAATMVTRACEEAAALVQLLHQSPVGDNYDFTEFTSVLIPVCTPYPIWVPVGLATRSLSGDLRRSVSLDELRAFCGG